MSWRLSTDEYRPYHERHDGPQRPSDGRDDGRRDHRHVEMNQRVASSMIDSFNILMRTNEYRLFVRIVDEADEVLVWQEVPFF